MIPPTARSARSRAGLGLSMKCDRLSLVISAGALLLSSACNHGGSAGPPALHSIAVLAGSDSVELGFSLKLIATGTYADGSTKDLSSSVSWRSTDPAIASVDAHGNTTAVGIGSTTIDAALGSIRGSMTLTVAPLGLLKNVGIYTVFERRGWASGYGSGETIQNWAKFDSVVGRTVAEEVSTQLDKMKAMGVNTITFELRAADPAYTGPFVPPTCNIPPVIGLQFPQPTATELANLPLFFDMVESKGMKVWLRLTNTHMEEQPPTNSQTWLGSIVAAIGGHPALDLVLFEGDAHLNTDPSGTMTCGIPAEPPLWLGPGSIPARYVEWAIRFAMSQGMPSRKLSAEAIVGDFFVESQPPAGPTATGGHLWSPIAVEKTIFDDLGVPAAERTYALSFYEHRKCSDAPTLPCTDLDPHDWADETVTYVTGVVGNGPRIVATEMGDLTPVDQVNWNTQHAVESLVFLLHKYGLDGGAFWRWTSFDDSEDSDLTLAQPIKQRGVRFVYNPVQKEIVDMGGLHVASVPNGLFGGAVVGGVPQGWTAAGSGTVSQYLLTKEPGEPEVPSRGDYAMRLVTGAAAANSVTATSGMIPVVPSTVYTTTSNLRFSWTGDPNPGGPVASRPHVFVTILHFRSDGTPSTVHGYDSSAFFQEDGTAGFATFPMQYATPSDAAFVALQFGAARNGLPTPITLDVQNVR